MEHKPENPPAFPRTGEGFGNPMYDAPGMTLRDYFAGQALAGLLAVGDDFHDDEGDGWNWHARASYAMADAMLAARNA